MLSRLAGNCFWLGRYLERAEANARLLRAINRQSLLPGYTRSADLYLTALAVVDDLEGFHDTNREVSAQAVLRFMIADLDNPSSIVSCLRAVRENARSARHALTAGYWEAVNATWLEAQKLATDGLDIEHIEGTLDWAIHRCQWIRGAGDDLRRGEVPDVLTLGQSVERSDFTARLLQIMLKDLPKVDPANPPLIGDEDYRCWMAMLEAADIVESWLHVHQDRVVGEPALHLLVANAGTTRSLLTNARRMVSALESAVGRDDSPALHAATELVHRILAITFDDEEGGVPDDLQSALPDIVQRVWKVSDLALEHHFSIPTRVSSTE